MTDLKVKQAAKKATVEKTVSKAANSITAAKASEKPKTVKETVQSVPPATGKKTPASKAAATPAAAQLTPEEHYRMVQTAAYFIAEREGFVGDSSNYWMAAELEIANHLHR